MRIDSQLILDSFLILISVFFTVYIIYGRIKRKPLLIGDYKPGMPGYEEFLKIVNNNWSLVAAVLVSLFSITDFIINTSKILSSSGSKAILVAAPVIAAMTFLVALWVAPYVVGKKDVKSKRVDKK